MRKPRYFPNETAPRPTKKPEGAEISLHPLRSKGKCFRLCRVSLGADESFHIAKPLDHRGLIDKVGFDVVGFGQVIFHVIHPNEKKVVAIQVVKTPIANQKPSTCMVQPSFLASPRFRKPAASSEASQGSDLAESLRKSTNLWKSSR